MQEGFETAAIPNTIWSVKNLSSLPTNWQQTSTAAATGSKSVKVDQAIEPGTIVELYTPSYNFASMPGVALTLKWAGSERDATSTTYDIFSVQFSTNCGTTWSPRLTKNIKAGTVGISPTVGSGFVPASSDFYQETVNLAGLTSEPNVIIKFKFTAENGSSNNFYVDDINLTSATGIQEQQLFSNIQLFPNPATDKISVEFDLTDNKLVEIELKDVLGRTIHTGIKEKFIGRASCCNASFKRCE